MASCKKIFVLLLIAGIQACSSVANHKAMTSKTLSSIDTLHAYYLVPQDEIKPDVQLIYGTAAVAGPIIAKIVESSENHDRTSDANQAMMSLYNQLVDYDFRKVIANEMNASLSQHFKIVDKKDRANPIVLNYKEIRERVKALSDSEAFVYTKHHYQLRNDSRIVQTITKVSIYLASQNPKVNKPDYHNTFYYQSPAYGPGGNDSIELWAQNSASLFKRVMLTSVQETLEAIHYDMQLDLEERCLWGGRFKMPADVSTENSLGMVVAEENDRVKFRATNGGLYLLNRADVEARELVLCRGRK